MSNNLNRKSILITEEMEEKFYNIDELKHIPFSVWARIILEKELEKYEVI